MKKREVIEKILAYHPNLPDYHGCDDWKAGDTDSECTGVVTALAPTVNVIKKAAELGANLIIAHEPTFYTSLDEPGWFEDFPNSVYEEKKKLLDENGISIWRDHDHMHAHQPDGIFTGVLKYLGWENDCTVEASDAGFAHFIVKIPKTTVGELCRKLIDTIGLNGLRYIGDPSAEVSTLAIVGHLYPMHLGKTRSDGKPLEYGVQIIDTLERKADVILPGEIIEWTALSYVRDAVQLGKAKAVINLGHFNWEELGMKYAQEWISGLLDGAVPVTYVPSEDMWRFA